MKLYRIRNGALLQGNDNYYHLHEDWDALINRVGLYGYLEQRTQEMELIAGSDATSLLNTQLLAPIGQQEVWAAGVTYMRSREARMEESKDTGGADFYDKVYEATRPELFFKSLPHRVSGHGQELYIRKDSAWNVPEPELTLLVNSWGQIQGYTIGNDMSSRSIEGENPLYLPQAKVYEKSAGLGPCLFVPERPIDPQTIIEMSIIRDGRTVFHDKVSISRMKRSHTELVDYLFKETDFPFGCFLMTGTCLVPPGDFTLRENDQVEIQIGGIGKLVNHVAFKKG